MAPRYHRPIRQPRRIEIDGVVYDSATEAGRAQELIILQKAREIEGFEPHPTLTLGGIVQKLDFFVWTEDHQLQWYEEIKGWIPPTWSRLKQLWKMHGPCTLIMLHGKPGKWAKQTIEPAIAPKNPIEGQTP